MNPRNEPDGSSASEGFELRKSFHPLHHYVDIAQGTEALKQALAGLLHRFPVRVGIEGHQSIGQRAATAQGDAQIMDGVGSEIAETLRIPPKHEASNSEGR